MRRLEKYRVLNVLEDEMVENEKVFRLLYNLGSFY